MADVFGPILITLSSILGVVFAIFQFKKISAIEVDRSTRSHLEDGAHDPYEVLLKCYNAIEQGAKAFLRAEYTLCLGFTVIFAAVIFFLTAHVSSEEWDFSVGALSSISFTIGAITSLCSGYIGVTRTYPIFAPQVVSQVERHVTVLSRICVTNKRDHSPTPFCFRSYVAHQHDFIPFNRTVVCIHVNPIPSLLRFADLFFAKEKGCCERHCGREMLCLCFVVYALRFVPTAGPTVSGWCHQGDR